MPKGVRRGPSRPVFNKPTREFEQEAPFVREREPDPNYDLLTEEDKDAIRLKAKAKVEAQEKDRAWQAYLAAEIERIERENHPEAYEEEKEIEIDLALYADRIIINGRHYMHGRKYTVKKGLYDAMQDIMWKTRKHFADTHRDPMQAMMQAQQAIAKGGPSYATVHGSTGQVTKF